MTAAHHQENAFAILPLHQFSWPRPLSGALSHIGSATQDPQGTLVSGAHSLWTEFLAMPCLALCCRQGVHLTILQFQVSSPFIHSDIQLLGLRLAFECIVPQTTRPWSVASMAYSVQKKVVIITIRYTDGTCLVAQTTPFFLSASWSGRSLKQGLWLRTWFSVATSHYFLLSDFICGWSWSSHQKLNSRPLPCFWEVIAPDWLLSLLAHLLGKSSQSTQL